MIRYPSWENSSSYAVEYLFYKPLSPYSFKNTMETRFSPISIGDSCFLSLVVVYSFYCVLNSAMFINVYHGRCVYMP